MCTKNDPYVHKKYACGMKKVDTKYIYTEKSSI